MIQPTNYNSASFEQPDVVMHCGHGPTTDASDRPAMHFDATSEVAWCELLLDVVATANSGGGEIRVVCDRARPSVTIAALTTPAIAHRLAQYTDSPFDDITVQKPENATSEVIEVIIGPAEFPIGFRRSAPRAAASHLDHSESVFAAGRFYFRRGDHSVPGTSADLRAFFERKLDGLRRRWLRRIRRVMQAPIESRVEHRIGERAAAVTPGIANLQPVRIVTDPNAPALQPQHMDRLFPWRQKDLVNELNGRFGRRALTTYDIQAVRRQHDLDARPDFVFHLPGAGRRYSPAVADWMMEQFTVDPAFFENAHAADQAMLRLRRQKPR